MRANIWTSAGAALALGSLVAAGGAEAGGSIKDAPYAPISNWTGVYIGAHLGGGWGDADLRNVERGAPLVDWPDLIPGDRTSHDVDGWLGGGHIGYNHQTGPWVLGVEAAYSAANLEGKSTSGPGPFSLQDDVFKTRIDSLLLLTGRIGYAQNNWLIYGKGGYAGANVKSSVADSLGASTGSGRDTNWLNGWTLGTGVEYMLTKNWILGLEYDYVHLDGARANLGDAAGSYVWDVKVDDLHVVTGRLSYKLN